MSDPIKLLNEELNQLTRLFKQDLRMGGQSERAAEDEADAICDLVTIHTALERELVYPAVRTVDAGMADCESTYHDKAERLIATARGCAGSGTTAPVLAAMKELHGAVSTHARWEEDVLAPKLHELSTAAYDQLGQDMYRRNQELLHHYRGVAGATVLTEGFSGAPKL